METKEALELAEEARKNGYLNKYPKACITLADEVERLNQHIESLMNSLRSAEAF